VRRFLASAAVVLQWLKYRPRDCNRFEIRLGEGQTVAPRKLPPPNMALQRIRRPGIRSGRSLRSLGSPLNARPFGG
jgi:hypothetical protein